MAKSKRKSAHKTPRRHSRRISGVMNKDWFGKAAGAIVGFVGARMISDKVAPTLDAKIKGAVLIGAGLFGIPMLLKNKLGEGMSLGFAVAGGEKLLQATGVIAGTSYLPYTAVKHIAGNGISQQVGGTDGIQQTVGGSERSYRRRRAEA